MLITNTVARYLVSICVFSCTWISVQSSNDICTPLSTHLIFDHVFVDFGHNIGKHVENKVSSRLAAVKEVSVYRFRGIAAMEQQMLSAATTDQTLGKEEGNVLVLLLGNSLARRELLPQLSLDDLDAESFTLHFQSFEPQQERMYASSSSSSFSYFVMAADGLPLADHTHKNVSFDTLAVHYGAVLSAYVALEHLGFSFIHPLEPYVPPQLQLQCSKLQIQRTSDNLVSKDDLIKAVAKAAVNQAARVGDLPHAPPHSAPSVRLGHTSKHASSTSSVSYSLTESPYWPERSFHIHTQHPLELTDVLQGHDIPRVGPHGPECRLFSTRDAVPPRGVPIEESGTNSNKRSFFNATNGNNKHEHMYCERFESMVQDVDDLFEWAIANRLNKIEWLLLGHKSWGDELDTRHKRLKLLTSLGHKYSLLIGADCPLGNIQQHGWYVVNVRLPFPEQVRQIQERVDWVFTAGFDYMTTESGMSEFSHPECGLMLDLLSAYAMYINITWGRECAVKVHCSTSQYCSEYPDPRTGDPINFNFLPTHAHSSMGVLPHTVQFYGLDDPIGGSYGNENFSATEEYIVFEAKQGNRSVVYYGETAYWVNVDIDVPLFLPIYAQRRLRDLRRIAAREKYENFRMQGQMNFDSGWEWGYWLSDVVTARASWDPLMPKEFYPSTSSSSSSSFSSSSLSLASSTCGNEANCAADSAQCSCDKENKEKKKEEEKFSAHNDQWEVFARSLLPVTDIFGEEYSLILRQLLVRFTRLQEELLIFGRVNGQESKDISKLSGIPYLSGSDTWVDLPRKLGLPLTQSDKVHMREVKDKRWNDVLVLLKEMKEKFGEEATQWHALFVRINNTFHTQNNEAGDLAPEREEEQDEKRVEEEDGLDEQQQRVLRQQQRGRRRFALNQQAVDIMRELSDCVHILALRAKQQHLLYLSQDVQHNRKTSSSSPSASPLLASTEANGGSDNVTSYGTGHESVAPSLSVRHSLLHEPTELLMQSRAVVSQAGEIVQRRESFYRVPWQRIAAWRENPTVYRYQYLWAVHSLYFWWRDQGLAERGSQQSEASPCYLNRMDITQVAVGWGRYYLQILRNLVNRYSPFSSTHPVEIFNCLSPPPTEYVFPKDLYSV